MKICITTSEMSQIQWQLGEGRCKQRSFIVEIPNTLLPIGLLNFLNLRDTDDDFKKLSNVDSITIVED